MNQEIKKIIKKLEEYEFDIFDQYFYEKDYYIVTDSIILCYDLNIKKLILSFQASNIPEIVATIMIILKEIDGIKEFVVMESFMMKGEEMLIGDEAYEYAKRIYIKKEVCEIVNTHNQLQNLLYVTPHGTC